MFSILSSNIRFDNPGDGDNAWSSRKLLLANKMLELSPCIIGTQEGREPQLRELENYLTNYRIIDTERNWISERMYPCLFLNKKYDLVEKSGDIWLSNTPAVAGSKDFLSAFPRLATWVRLKDFFVVNLHLDHTYESTRLEQTKVLCQEVSKIIKPEEPLIVMGDFNTDPDSEVHNYICDYFKLIDPWQVLKKTEETSFHHFKGHLPEGKRIDWILHSKIFKTLSIELIKDNYNGVYLSDHYPVYCKLSF